MLGKPEAQQSLLLEAAAGKMTRRLLQGQLGKRDDMLYRKGRPLRQWVAGSSG
jgi:hypothetical protein